MREGAALALGLMEAGIIDAADAERDDDPASLSAFKTALAVAKRSLELTDELYRTLEVTTCLFP